MIIEFEKWHGCLNDFIVVPLANATFDLVSTSLAKAAATLCSKKGNGIGADGIICYGKGLNHDIPMSIINSDGSFAKNCGNGIRCAAGSFLRNCRDDQVESVSFKVYDHSFHCEFISYHKENPYITMLMPVPHINQACTPFQQLKDSITPVLQTHQITDWYYCEIGNPHLVITTNDPQQKLLELGERLQQQHVIDGVNVHCVQEANLSASQAKIPALIRDHLADRIDAYCYERGVGITPACGSGACAIAACFLSEGFIDRSNWIQISMPGGDLFCRQEAPESPVQLAGPATFVYSGKFEL